MCSLAAILQNKNKFVVEGRERIRGEKREIGEKKRKEKSFLGLGDRGDFKSERQIEGERENTHPFDKI